MFLAISVAVHSTTEFIHGYIFLSAYLVKGLPLYFFKADTCAMALPGRRINDGNVAIDEGLG